MDFACPRAVVRINLPPVAGGERTRQGTPLGHAPVKRNSSFPDAEDDPCGRRVDGVVFRV